MVRQVAWLVAGVLLAWLVWVWLPEASAEEGAAQVKQAAQGLLPYFAEQPKQDYAQRFTETFLKAVPPKKLTDVFQTLHKQCGKAQSIKLVKMTAPYTGDVEFACERGNVVPATLAVEPRKPHKLTALVLRSPVREGDSFDGIAAEFKALPGKAAYAVVRLSPNPEVIAQHNADQSLAVASTFKIVVLATLVQDIASGKRNWTDVTPLRKDCVSLSSGVLQDWPEGSPVTLHTLAGLMISKSDNTAADHLMKLLGRERIETMQETLGIASAERNRPWLLTGEMFKIKLVMHAERQKEYAAAGPTRRRQFLQTWVKDTPLKDHRLPGEPLLLDEVEWWFSCRDLCRVMDWLRRQEKVPEALKVLAIHNGLHIEGKHWSYVGYKGGAEAGVLSFVMLLKDQQNQWFAVASICNDPARDPDETRLIDLTRRLAQLLEKPASK